MDLNLKDKVYLVTGGAKGIGAAIVQQICAESGRAVILDRDAEAGNKLVSELENKGGKALFVQADLCDSKACENAVHQAVHELGSIHGLVNNAGVNDGVGLENGSPESFRISLNKNLNHFFDISHFALPHLKETQGTIVNIASKTAITGQGSTSGYAASKGAILALTREWAVELLKYSIRVNAVIPAEVMTPLYQQWLQSFDNPEEKAASITRKIPLGKRMTKAEEIADMVLFLLSERASHITGQHIHVDGGYTHLDRIL